MKYRIVMFALGVLLPLTHVFAQTAPEIASFSPEQYTTAGSATAPITVRFDRAMSAASFQTQTFVVYGGETGYVSGAIAYDANTLTAAFTPDTRFHPGERIAVTLTTGIEDTDGNALAAPFHWAFHAPSGLAAANFSFDATLPAGDGPHYVDFGDLNNDGAAEVVVPHSLSDDVYTWANDGSGALTQDGIFGVGRQPRSLTLGDFDRDEDIDIAVANENPNETNGTITILDNDGTGQFAPRTTPLTVGTEPTNITAGDLNGDGFLDLVTANYEGASVSVLLSAGDGSFTPQVEYSVGVSDTSRPQSVALADFNNDGFPDVAVVLDEEELIAVLLNDGTGTLQAQQTFAGGGRPHSIAAADFDRDGFADVAFGNRVQSGTVAILFNNGDATFSQPVTYPVGDEPIALHSSDLNGDSAPDLAVVSRVSNEVHILLNDGTGILETQQVIATGNDLRGVRTGDLDGDAVLDLVVASWNADNISTFFNAPVQNEPPAAPTLVSPGNRVFVNPDTSALTLAWNVPADPENQPLHFVIELSPTSDFATIATVFDSRTDAGFTPPPPVDQNTASVSFAVPNSLADGIYWWRVKAWDGSVFGQPSTSRNFIIDSTPPVIESVRLTNVDLAPNWYNQSTTSPNVQVQYDEANAMAAGFNLSTVGQIATIAGIPGGNDQTIQQELNLSTVADGSYQITVSLSDSAGNAASDVTEIALDSTPPSGTQASSPPTSASLTFTVSWGNAVEDGSGVATYDVQVQTDGGAWQPYLTGVAQTTAQFTGEQRREYGFEAVAADSLGNAEPFTNSAETVTLVDTTSDDTEAPEAPLSLTANGANPSPWQNDPEFVIEWQEPADASGIARALYKLGSAPTSNFDNTGEVVGETSVPVAATQENGQSFYLWFVDNAGNVDFNRAGSVLLRYDGTPPAGATARSPGTSSSENIVVSWGGGSDGSGSGLADRYDVQYQVDGGDWQSWFVNTAETSAIFQGQHGSTYGFEAAVYDVTGNVEAFSDQPESETVVDTSVTDSTPPTIQHTRVEVVEQGQDLTIQAQITDDAAVQGATLFYASGGQASFQSMAMTNTDATAFEAVVAAAQIPLAGLRYYIMASDGTNVSYHPSTYETVPHAVSVRISGSNQQGLVRSRAQPAGTTAAAYRMISVPLALENSSAESVLADELGTYDGISWRLFQYDPSTEIYNEFPEIDPFTPGKAFWLIVRDDNIRLDSGIGTSVSTNQPFEITLQGGWNDIANPFVFAVDWNDVSVTSGDPADIMGPYTYQDDWLLPSQVTTLQPWEGYSVFSQVDGITIAIAPQAASSSSTLTKPLVPAAEWYIQISAQTSDIMDEHNYLGVARHASDTWDANDYLEPPRIGPEVSLYFPHDAWQGFRGAFATDFRPAFHDGQSWEFAVQTRGPDREVTLRFRNLESLPIDFSAVLVDPLSNNRLDLSRSVTHTYRSGESGSVRNFRILVGREAYIANSEDFGNSTPESFSLSQNYPNPFNAGTTVTYDVPEAGSVKIQIVNLIGEVVRELVSGEHLPGTYRAYWDGRSERGAELGSGVYLIRMQAGNVHKIRKVVLIK